MWKNFLRAIDKIPYEKNRFGGLKFELQGTQIDAWPISQTWAFTSGQSLPDSPTILPETTLLNIESVVCLLWHPEEPWVFEKGFFEGMETRTLEIQNPATIYPVHCLERIQKYLDSGTWKAGESVTLFQEYWKQRTPNQKSNTQKS